MDFTSIDAKSGGKIILTPDNTRITSGEVQLPDDFTVSAAASEVTGQEGFASCITLPEDEYLLTNGSESDH